jgi:hypothetical protein
LFVENDGAARFSGLRNFLKYLLSINRYVSFVKNSPTLTEAQVVIEDWRWKYNHSRPHRSLGYITPNEFAQDEVEEEAQGQFRTFGRATPCPRLCIELLYDILQIISPSRLNIALAQLG